MWLEEPTPPANTQAMASIARKTSIPVATGETVSYTHLRAHET